MWFTERLFIFETIFTEEALSPIDDFHKILKIKKLPVYKNDSLSWMLYICMARRFKLVFIVVFSSLTFETLWRDVRITE